MVERPCLPKFIVVQKNSSCKSERKSRFVVDILYVADLLFGRVTSKLLLGRVSLHGRVTSFEFGLAVHRG